MNRKRHAFSGVHAIAAAIALGAGAPREFIGERPVSDGNYDGRLGPTEADGRRIAAAEAKRERKRRKRRLEHWAAVREFIRQQQEEMR